MKQSALIIGNNSYPDATLKNAVNDATDIATRLAELGFTCTLATDASHKEMDRNLSGFASQLPLNEVGLFFFAGHGMQIDGENYLAAVDTNFETELDAKFSCLPLNKVIEAMELSSGRTSIIILDACRNNPYERRWRGGASRGLAPVYAPKGMIIGYATSPGQVASDGNGRNGAYSEAILSHLSQQDLSIETFFKRVRNSLSSSTNGKQISWEHTSLMGDYFFNHSRASTGTVTAYSEEVLSDGAYLPRGPLQDIIAGLKSYDWHQQNPAMGSLSPQRLENVGKDDCFVLGRNIYQASCGGSFSAVSFVESLAQSLSPYSEFARLHLLNGILYEIYFDSRGLKRKRTKADKLDEVFALEESPLFSDSFKFIHKALQPYFAELFYVPGSKSEVCLDVVLGKSGELPAVTRIGFEGQNILYNAAGDGYFNSSTELTGHTESRLTLRARISAAIATPSFRLKLTYTGVPLAGDKFEAPCILNLQRIAPK